MKKHARLSPTYHGDVLLLELALLALLGLLCARCKVRRGIVARDALDLLLLRLGGTLSVRRADHGRARRYRLLPAFALRVQKQTAYLLLVASPRDTIL